MEGIQVSTEVAGSQNQISIIKVGGFIDTTTSSEVERSLNSLLKQGRFNIIIDLGNVDYISSAGWGIFISEIKSIREHNGDLKLVRMIPDVYEIFELLEFHHILDVYDSVNEAVKRFEDSLPKAAPAEVYQDSLAGRSAANRPVEHPVKAQPITESEDDQDRGDYVSHPKTFSSDETKPSHRTFKSIEDKIKHIVAFNPNLGAYKINKLLNTQEYGFEKVGWFGVRSILNKMGLNNRKSRRKFALTYMQTQMKDN